MFDTRTTNIPTTKDTKMTQGGSVSSNLIRESCVLNVPVGSVWEGFKTFELEKMSPSLITSCKFLTGNPAQVGSTYQVDYKDGSSVVYMIVELSELKRTMTIEMIESTPQMPFTSMLTTLKFCKVTENDSTFFTWQALFSNDVTTDILKSKKDKCMQLFKDFRTFFEKQGNKKF